MNKYTVFFISLITLIITNSLFSQDVNNTDTVNKSSVEINEQTVVVIPVEGDVDPGMAAFIGKSIDDAKIYEDPFFIIEMNTFGGRVDAALQIVDTLSSIPKGRSIAFVKTKAISAGALIALSCSKLSMRENTTIGDCAPISFSKDGATMLGEKFQSPLRAKFRALAKRNNYPESLAESMVTADISIYKVETSDTILYLDSLEFSELTSSFTKKIISKKTIVKNGELLTMNNHEAMDLGFSSFSVNSIKEVLAKLNIKKYNIVRIKESWSVDFVRFIGKISSILIMIGLAALYTEVKSPGFAAPGIIGVSLLALVFFSQYMIGMADYTEILLLSIGSLLLAAEVFVIPGFGIAGIAGILFISAGMILSFQDFVIPNPKFPWQKDIMQQNLQMITVSLSGSIVLLILFFKYAYPKLSLIVHGPNLMENLSSSHVDSVISTKILAGDKGVVTKTLRPSGNVEIKGISYDAIADGEFIDKDTEIEVVEIHTNSVLVKRSDA